MAAPRIHFILVNESADTNKITLFLYKGLRLYLDTKIFLYYCPRERVRDRFVLYKTWFTDIMLSRNEREVIIVKHHEDDGVSLGSTFDMLLHQSFAQYKHFISVFNVKSAYNIPNEARFVFMSRLIMPSIWSDFTKLPIGNPLCLRFLDFDHVPDNPGMHFDY